MSTSALRDRLRRITTIVESAERLSDTLQSHQNEISDISVSVDPEIAQRMQMRASPAGRKNLQDQDSAAIRLLSRDKSGKDEMLGALSAAQERLLKIRSAASASAAMSADLLASNAAAASTLPARMANLSPRAETEQNRQQQQQQVMSGGGVGRNAFSNSGDASNSSNNVNEISFIASHLQQQVWKKDEELNRFGKMLKEEESRNSELRKRVSTLEAGLSDAIAKLNVSREGGDFFHLFLEDANHNL